MARYRITTPAAGFTGQVGNVHFANGAAEVDDQADDGRHAAALAYFRAQGYGVEDLDGEAEPVAPSGPATAPAEDEPPAKGASKDAWIGFAIRQGMTPEDAARLTKDELVERFGQKGASS